MVKYIFSRQFFRLLKDPAYCRVRLFPKIHRLFLPLRFLFLEHSTCIIADWVVPAEAEVYLSTLNGNDLLSLLRSLPCKSFLGSHIARLFQEQLLRVSGEISSATPQLFTDSLTRVTDSTEPVETLVFMRDFYIRLKNSPMGF